MPKKILVMLDVHYRTYVAMLYDITAAIFSFTISVYLPFWVAHGSNYPNIPYPTILSLVLLVQMISFYRMGLYRGIWRFSSTPDLIRVIKGATLGVLASFLVVFLFNRLQNIPRSAFILDWFILLVTLGGGRFAYRIWKDRPNYATGENVLIVGAGDAGAQLVREINQNPSVPFKVIGLIDDDPRKLGKSLHGINILGNVDSLPMILRKESVKKIFIAIPSASGKDVRKIMDACVGTEVEVQTLPVLSDLIHGKVELSLLRKLRPEDLLGRGPIVLDEGLVRNMLNDKVILVTGAGGSIGSEICTQVAKFAPKKLILFEQGELFLFELGNKLKELFPELELVQIIGDVRNLDSLDRAFSEYLPQVVFHAAAYKHVPLMEDNPFEAIETNIKGTKNVAECSHKFKTEKFVMISTDKAVNPTNIMGTTKRIAEMVCESMRTLKKSETKYITVRFGNVLGSHGSVIPLFKEQIEKGGPITVTHPEVNRFFMSIPEAAQLVLQASGLGESSEIFILDMGLPVKIIDLAKQMIQLAGLRPDIDIPIKIIGLRPGEKLYEEVLSCEETTKPTRHEKVKVASVRVLSNDFEKNLEHLFKIPKSSNRNEVRQILKILVPEFHPELAQLEIADTSITLKQNDQDGLLH